MLRQRRPAETDTTTTDHEEPNFGLASPGASFYQEADDQEHLRASVLAEEEEHRLAEEQRSYLNDQESHPKTEAQLAATDRAMDRLAQFEEDLIAAEEEGTQTAGVLANLTPSMFIQQLTDRLHGEAGVHQGVTWLCGPAALTHVLLIEDPVGYTELAISLYLTGSGRVGNGDAITMPDSMKGAEFNSDGKDYLSSMPGIDFMMVGALRDTANQSGAKRLALWAKEEGEAYNPGRATKLESGTLPNEISGMAENLYGLDVGASAYYRGENLKKIQSAVDKDVPVMLFVDTEGLSGHGDEKEGAKADGIFGVIGKHYIVVDSSHYFDQAEGKISFSYWDYGGETTHVEVEEDAFRTAVKGYWVLQKGEASKDR